MFMRLLQRLGLREGDSFETCLRQFEHLSQEDRDAIREAYLQADFSAVPDKRLAQEALRLWRVGERLQALDLYGRVIDQSPEDSILLLNRAQLHVELGNVEEAMCDFERARVGRPRLPEHFFVMHDGLQSMSPAALEAFVQKRKSAAS